MAPVQLRGQGLADKKFSKTSQKQPSRAIVSCRRPLAILLELRQAFYGLSDVGPYYR